MAESKYYGLYQGVVTNNNDPEKRGRIKVKCPDVLGGSTESAWCDPLVPVAYDNGGDFCVPVRDETVWLQFIAGDANRPVWLGSWWQKNMTPLGNNYTNLDDIRIINYADCTILMQNGRIDINVGGTNTISVENGNVTIKGDLSVEGSVTAYSVVAGTITSVSDETGDGSIVADGDISTFGTISADGKITTKSSIKASGNISGNDIIASGNVEASGDITAGNVEAEKNVRGSLIVGSVGVMVNGSQSVSLADHKHGGVTSGGDQTSGPV